MVVQIEKKLFAPLTKDNITFFSDSGKSPPVNLTLCARLTISSIVLAFQKLQKRITATDATTSFPVVTDELAYRFEAENAETPGWGYRFTVKPLYGEKLIETQDDRSTKLVARGKVCV
jgi:hypothetical protein